MFSAAIRISQSSLPRTGVLGYSQPSLAGLLLASCIPRTYVLGYSQPSLAGLKPEPAVLTQTLKPLRYDFPTFERHSDNGISANLGQRKQLSVKSGFEKRTSAAKAA